MRSQEQIMRDAGYVTASEAAEAIGANQVGTIHRMVQDGRLEGARAGRHWYVLVSSLLEEHKDAPPIVERILALGVESKPEPAQAHRGVTKATPRKKGGRNGRRSA